MSRQQRDERRARRELLAAATKERDVLRCVTDYLTAEGIWWMRVNIQLAPAGAADLLAIMPTETYFRLSKNGLLHKVQWAIPLWIECRHSSGKACRSPAQIAFADHMQSIGCLHVWAQDIQDVKAVIPPRSAARALKSRNSDHDRRLSQRTVSITT